MLGPFFDFAPKNLRLLDPASGSVHAVAGGVAFNVIQQGRTYRNANQIEVEGSAIRLT